MGFKIVRTTPKKRIPKEFSKRVIVAMTLLWFAMAIFGAVVAWRQGYGLESLLDYVGAPMTGAIIGYMAKSAFENREKIKKKFEQRFEEELPIEGDEHP